MAFVLDDLAIAALVATVVGAGAQYDASKKANSQKAREIMAAQARQTAFRKKATAAAMDAADTFRQDNRNEQQQQIEQQLTSEFTQPVNESQAVRSEQQTTQGNVSQDYTTAKAASDVETLKSAHALAKLMGKTNAAGRLRINEAQRLTDAGRNIDQLRGFALGQSGADQLSIDVAGQANPEKMLLGSLLQAGGTAALTYGGTSMGTAGSSTGSSLGTGALGANSAAATGTGLRTGANGLGLNSSNGMRILYPS
jgi:hypothetical protein